MERLPSVGMRFTIPSCISALRALPDRTIDRILLGCGVFLAACEVYKQLFLYFVINQGHYDWWFFPFQLCSLPMYLCLAMPFFRNRRLKTVLYTFMQDFNLLGGIAALVVPEGFLHIHWTLSIHGYVWHVLVVLIGLLLGLSGRTDLRRKGFCATLPVFGCACLVATLINVLAPGKGQADMFYISPFHPSSQFAFHGIALALGILPAHLLYLAAICAGGYVIHRIFACL